MTAVQNPFQGHHKWLFASVPGTMPDLFLRKKWEPILPALKATEFCGEITWLGRVVDRQSALTSEPLDQAVLDWGGLVGESHGGLTRPSCSRVTAQYPRNTEIRNTRQVSIVSREELAQIAAAMMLDGDLEPAWIGASVVVSGLPNLTHLPPGSRLQAPSGATVVVDMENRPCRLPAK